MALHPQESNLRSMLITSRQAKVTSSPRPWLRIPVNYWIFARPRVVCCALFTFIHLSCTFNLLKELSNLRGAFWWNAITLPISPHSIRHTDRKLSTKLAILTEAHEILPNFSSGSSNLVDHLRGITSLWNAPATRVSPSILSRSIRFFNLFTRTLSREWVKNWLPFSTFFQVFFETPFMHFNQKFTTWDV